MPASKNFNSAYLNLDGEDHLAYLLSKNGPVAIGIASNCAAFKDYKGGILNSCCIGMPDHFVLLTGLNKTSDGIEYWMIKNSWGTIWGINGYMNLRKGGNLCNILSTPAAVANFSGPVIS